jgi:hypothetical protein
MGERLGNLPVYDIGDDYMGEDEDTEELVKDAKKREEIVSVQQKSNPVGDVKPEGIMAKIWNKTVFPEMIERKKEENKIKKEVMHQARIEAIAESKDQIKEKLKEKEIKKLTGEGKKDFWMKMAKGFGYEEGKPSQTGNKIERMMGKQINTDKAGNIGSTNVLGNDKISDMMKIQSRKEMVSENIFTNRNEMNGVSSDAKINRILGQTKQIPKTDETYFRRGTSENINTDDKINRLLGKSNTDTQYRQGPIEDINTDDKIKKMLSKK